MFLISRKLNIYTEDHDMQYELEKRYSKFGRPHGSNHKYFSPLWYDALYSGRIWTSMQGYCVLFNPGEDTLQDEAFPIPDYHTLNTQAGIWRSTFLKDILYTEAIVHLRVPATIFRYMYSLFFIQYE